MKLNKAVTPDEAFPLVEKMLYKLAWKVQSPMLQFEEARSEAYLAFMKCCETFDPDRGMKFSSWCHYKVQRHLKSFITKRMKDRHVFCDEMETVAGAAPENRRELLLALDDLSGDAKDLISLLIETPQEILEELPMTPAQLLEKVRDYLGFTRGWDAVYSDITEHEIRMRFQEI